MYQQINSAFGFVEELGIIHTLKMGNNYLQYSSEMLAYKNILLSFVFLKFHIKM